MGSFVLLISDRVIHAAEEIHPDLNQSLCLTFRLKKENKEKKKKRQKQALKKFHPGTSWREGVQRHEEEGKREASRALQKYKATFPRPLFAIAPKFRSQGSKGMGSTMNA